MQKKIQIKPIWSARSFLQEAKVPKSLPTVPKSQSRYPPQPQAITT